MKEEYIVDYVFLVQFCEHYEKDLPPVYWAENKKKKERNTIYIWQDTTGND